jgi:hypothetical protein
MERDCGSANPHQERHVIAELAPPVPPSRYKTIKKVAERLEREVRGLPEYKKLRDMLLKTASDIDNRRAASHDVERIGVRKMDLAAYLAYDLVLEKGGAGPPSLTPDGPYIQLTKRLFRTAVNSKSSDSAAARGCSRHFAALQAQAIDGLESDEQEAHRRNRRWPYSPRGSRRRAVVRSNAELTEFDRWVAGDLETLRRERKEEMRRWPPLDQLLDAAEWHDASSPSRH